MSYDDLIKFRSTKQLVQRLHRIAHERRRDLPDLLRLILEDYAEEEEKKLGLDTLREEPPPYKISSKRKAEIGAEGLAVAKQTLKKPKTPST